MEKLTRYALITLGALAGGGLTMLVINNAKRIKPNGNVLFIGDSYTVGSSSYADQLKNKFPSLKIKKIAKVGEKTDWMLRNSASDLASGKYDAVFILGGINDVYAGVPASTTENNLQAIYSNAKKAGAKVIALTLPPTNYYADYTASKGYNADVINYWIKKNRTVNKVVDLNTLLKKGGKQNLDLFVADHLHATPQAHGMLANDIVKNVFKS